MNLYEMPQFNFSKKIKNLKKSKKDTKIIITAVSLSVFFGFLAGIVASILYFQFQSASLLVEEVEDNPQISQEEKIIKAVRESSPSVVSIIVSQEEGGGTGFIVSADGLVLTNKHVVLDEDLDYTVLMSDGREFPAEVLAKDPLEDLAIIRIEDSQPFPVLKLGDSDNLEIGQTVITIGNALSEFRNTVSSGIISGLGRRITASGDNFRETLENVIQTDAAINRGNSGGPLLNLRGEVIGINTAIAINAQSIGFAIPINRVKRAIKQVQETGKIIYPFIGIHYILIDNKVKKEEDLAVDYGVLIVNEIFPDSPADKADLQEGDIVLEFNQERITIDNSLAKIILNYNPGDEVTLKILRDGQEIDIELILSERED